MIYGGCGEVVNTADCGSVMRGFDPHHSPHLVIQHLLYNEMYYTMLTHRRQYCNPSRKGPLNAVTPFLFYSST